MGLFRRNYRGLPDERLMALVSQGETAAFDELYARYSRRLLHFFCRMLGGDEEKAQDFLQDIFLKIVERPGLFRTEERFSSWIFAVAHNMCKNEYRCLEVRKAVSYEPDMDRLSHPAEDEYQQAEKDVDHREFGRALFEELGKLDEIQRSTFLLRYQENLSIRQISDIVGCPEGTTKSRLFYIVRSLATKLKAFDPQKAEG